MSSIENSIAYSGLVKFTYTVGNRKVTKEYHNNGTAYLFDLIVRTLAHDSAPIFKYLKITSDSGVECLRSPNMITSIYADANSVTNEPILHIQSAISFGNLSDELRDVSDEFVNISLYSSSDNKLAFTKLSTVDLKKVTAGKQGIVDWLITFTNKE